MDTDMRFRINSPEVVSESFGGEVVAIHFGSGNYYSLSGTASEILALMGTGATVRETVDQLALRYNGRSSDIAGEVSRFVIALLQEELIVARDPREAEGLPCCIGEQEPPSADRTDFEPPRLEKYADMQDLLLLDPIHDVDEVGWPRALPETHSDG